ncbi:MAG: Ppx/GppA family phosphatase [Bacteroidales bacterium]|nr:Ppx/GppA family phosphatase [Bacteroidales bacterium]
MGFKEYKYAGIDIGSNAVRLIVNNVIPGDDYKDAIMNKLVYLRLPLRLGGDVFMTNRIGDQKTQEFTNAMQIYKDLIDFYKIESFRACATSATRSAENGKEVIELIKQKTGISIDVIDGVEESMLLYKTNLYNLPEGKTFLSADLGGGSLQLTLFEGDRFIWTHSYKIGTVRILSNSVNPKEFVDFEEKMKEIKEEFSDLRLIGSGGNINKISKLVGEKTVELNDIEKLKDELEPLSLIKRMKKHNLRQDRADVIVPASEIYIKLMKILDINKIFVPKIGLADGIIRELYEQNHD